MIPCPRCGAGLHNDSACPACQLPLTGETAAQLWSVDQEISRIDAQLAGLNARRTGLWQTHLTLLSELGGTAPMTLPVYGGPARTALPSVPPPLPRAQITTPRREWTPRRVQNLLLTIGALLLVIATAIFTAVSWHRLGDGPQSLILVALAAGAAILSRFLNRRALTATAEAIAAISIGVIAFTADAAHNVVLPGVTGRPYWAIATAVMVLVFAGLGRFTRTRVTSIAGAISALLPLLVLAFGANQPTADRALLLALDALLAAVALAALRRLGAEGRTVSDARTCWIAGGSLAWAGGFTVPVSHLLYGLGGASLIVVLGGLAASGCAAAATSWTVGDAQLPHLVPARAPLAGASGLTLICALTLPVQSHVDIVWWAATVITAALVVLTAASRLPGSYRSGPQWTALATAGVALSTELLSVSSTIAGQAGWYGQPWQAGTASLSGTAAQAAALPQQFGGAGNLVALLVAAAMALTAGWLLRRPGIGIGGASVLAALTTAIAVPQLGGSYGTGLALDACVTMIASAAAVVLQQRASTTSARTASVVALCSGALTLGWALALPVTTAIVGCWLVTVLLVAAALSVPWREQWLGAATLAGGYAAAGVAHELGAVDTALGLVVAGLAVAVALSLRFSRSSSTTADVLDLCCGLLVLAALALGAPDGGWLSWTLLVAVAWGGVVCLRPARRPGTAGAVGAAMIALVVLPPAQDLPVAAVLASWVGLVAIAVAGAAASVLLGGQPSTVRRFSAGTLAIGSATVAVLTIGLAVVEQTGVTPCLVALLAVYGAAAASPSSLFAGRGVRPEWRAVATALATALLPGGAGSAAYDGSLETGTIAIIVAILSGSIAVGAGRMLARRPLDAVVAEVTSVVGMAVALRVATPDAIAAGWVLAIAGLAVLLTATTPTRRRLWPAGVFFLAAASWVWLRHAGVDAPEPYTDPVAVVALVAGYLRRRSIPTTPSFTAYGAGLVALLLPSLLWALGDSSADRPLLLAALATAVVIVGAQQGLRAPLILGGSTLILTALRLMAPYETLIPRWVEVGTAGTLLLVVGATYEQRRRDVQLLRSRYDALV